MSSAPDYAEPFVAWRAWRIRNEPEGQRLRSVVFPVNWVPGQELVAECKCRARSLLRPWRYRRCELAPARACDCGIYGAREVADAIDYLGHTTGSWDPSNAVIGQVSLWGEIMEHRLGWRASRAYPARIWVPLRPGSDRVAAALDAYGVPVEQFECSRRRDVQSTLERLRLERL